jgi:hypothetical protein
MQMFPLSYEAKGQVLLWNVFDELLAVSSLEEGTKFSLGLQFNKCHA